VLFNNWNALLGTLLVGVMAYISVVILLRISGKRTLSKWNAFDFIVTVALGSALANAILSQQVSLLQGITGLFVLIFLQLTVTWLSVRFRFIEKLVKSKPGYLVLDGEFLKDRMRKERVTESEVRAALRDKGIGSIKEVKAVILETDGNFSIIREAAEGPDSTLADVVKD
jgi:uncharacterized membrane protein YcaP (DUF421 family)